MFDTISSSPTTNCNKNRAITSFEAYRRLRLIGAANNPKKKNITEKREVIQHQHREAINKSVMVTDH